LRILKQIAFHVSSSKDLSHFAQGWRREIDALNKLREKVDVRNGKSNLGKSQRKKGVLRGAQSRRGARGGNSLGRCGEKSPCRAKPKSTGETPSNEEKKKSQGILPSKRNGLGEKRRTSVDE